jgi:hypothetical protein
LRLCAAAGGVAVGSPEFASREAFNLMNTPKQIFGAVDFFLRFGYNNGWRQGR